MRDFWPSFAPPPLLHAALMLLAVGFLLPIWAGAAGGEVSTASRDAAERAAGLEADAIVREAMRKHRIPGVCLGVLRGGRLIKSEGYGYANLEWQTPVTPQTIFQSGSVGKQFTATLVMMLVEDGKIALDAPISNYLPEAASAKWRAVTIRQLLTHTSGIPDIFGSSDADSYDKGILDFRRDYTEEELLRRYALLDLDFPAGERWSYSNTGYEILGFLIHRVSGRFYGDLLRERIFTPLGMSSTRIISEADIVPRRAAGYRIVEGELKNQEWIAPSLNTTADGSLYTNLVDLAKWDAALNGGTLLPAAALAQMHTPVRLNSGARYPYGFGWEMAEKDGRPVQYHTGSNQGFAISISRYVRDRLTVIVLTNLDSTHSVTLQIAEPVASLYLESKRAGAMLKNRSRDGT